MDHRFILIRLLVILVLVYMFVVGIGAMGHSFMLLGQSFADSIIKATASPVVALFVGILATSFGIAGHGPHHLSPGSRSCSTSPKRVNTWSMCRMTAAPEWAPPTPASTNLCSTRSRSGPSR